MRKFLSLLVVGVMMWVLVSCGSDAKPEPQAPSNPTPTPTVSRPSPTATPPEIGGFIHDFTSEGAAAFFHYFVAVMNYSTVTGDLEEFERLSAETCETCEAVRDRIRRTYDAGGYIVSSEWSIKGLVTEARATGVLLNVDLDIAPGEFAESSGQEPTRSNESSITINAWMTQDGDSWTVGDFSAQEDES